jgi:hypothetical protein
VPVPLSDCDLSMSCYSLAPHSTQLQRVLAYSDGTSVCPVSPKESDATAKVLGPGLWSPLHPSNSVKEPFPSTLTVGGDRKWTTRPLLGLFWKQETDVPKSQPCYGS